MELHSTNNMQELEYYNQLIEFKDNKINDLSDKLNSMHEENIRLESIKMEEMNKKN